MPKIFVVTLHCQNQRDGGDPMSLTGDLRLSAQENYGASDGEDSVVDHESIAIAGGAVAVEGLGGARLRHAAIVEVVDALTARAGGHALEVDGEAR